MNPALTAPQALPVPAAKPVAFGRYAAVVIAVSACVLMFLHNALQREGYTGDEGFYGVAALNMTGSPGCILQPSYFPAGDFMADRDGFAHPPFNSYFYAVSLWISGGSRIGPEVLNILNFAALLFFAYQVLALFDRRAARFTVVLLAASLPVIGYFSMLEAEPLMTTFGLISLYCVLQARLVASRVHERSHHLASWMHSRPVRGMLRGIRVVHVARPGEDQTGGAAASLPSARGGSLVLDAGSSTFSRRWIFLAGLALGTAFALKLWLFGPVALAVVVALAIMAWSRTSRFREYVGDALLFVLGLAAPAALHLLFVAWRHPEDLGFWLQNIYFGVFTNAGISGSKLGGAAPAEWVHPMWYYGAALYRDHFFLLPPVVFGLGAVRKERQRCGILLLIVVAGCIGVAPLSVLKVKEPLYVLSCAVFAYMLAGLCLAAMSRRYRAHRGLGPVSLWTGTAIVTGFMVLFPLAYARGLQPGDITPPFVVAHTLTFATTLAIVHWAERRKEAKAFARTVYAACAVAMIAGFSWNWAIHQPRDATIANIIQPEVSKNAPGVLSMLATNFKGFQYYTFRRGQYWHELPAQRTPEEVLAMPAYQQVRAFVLGPDDQATEANAPWVQWLQVNTTEKTPEVDRRLGGPSGYRVFVRELPAIN